MLNRTMTLAIFALAALAIPAAMAQGPGNGVSKTTYASTYPWPGMAFVQKYFPTTCAEDSGSGNVQGYTFQGRSQLTLANQFTSRNCHLYSSADGSASGSGTSMTPPGTNYGADCTYIKSSTFAKTTKMYSVYAHTADQCCKACQAASVVAGGSCVGATYHDVSAITTDNDNNNNNSSSSNDEMASVSLLEVSQGPQRYEGFGLHLVDVSDSLTKGGMNISAIEMQFSKRMGDMSSYDAFMDFNVVLYAGDDLPTYAAALSADSIDYLTAVWTAYDSTTWHSLIVYVPHSQMIMELVSQTAPGVAARSATSVKLEARLSPRQIKRFSSSGKANGVLQTVSVTRGCSNMSSIELFYKDAIQATNVHSVSSEGLERRCFAWSGADADVCFVQRSEGSQGTTTDAAKSFTVLDLETTLWSGHAAMIGNRTNVQVYNDRYNDNHYAVDLRGFSGDNIVSWFNAHQSEAFPIDFPNTFFAWDCDQDYIIDPTGWAIQSDFQFSSGGLPGCGYKAPAADARVAAKQALTPVDV